MTDKATTTELFERAVSSILQGVGTSIPGAIQEFDPETQQALVVVGIEKIIGGQRINIPPIQKVPVIFCGGSYGLEFELNPGDEGLIIISQRCLDAWKDEGGISTNPIRRFHDIQDAIFIPGVRSQKNKLSNFTNNGIRLRDKDADNYVWLQNDGKVEIKCQGFNVDSPTFTHNGVDIGEDHQHDDTGTYNVSGSPVAGTSGKPL